MVWFFFERPTVRSRDTYVCLTLFEFRIKIYRIVKNKNKRKNVLPRVSSANFCCKLFSFTISTLNWIRAVSRKLATVRTLPLINTSLLVCRTYVSVFPTFKPCSVSSTLGLLASFLLLLFFNVYK